MVEGRVFLLGILIMISGSIPHNSTWDPLGMEEFGEGIESHALKDKMRSINTL